MGDGIPPYRETFVQMSKKKIWIYFLGNWSTIYTPKNKHVPCKGSFQKERNLATIHFQGLCLVLGNVKVPSITLWKTSICTSHEKAQGTSRPTRQVGAKVGLIPGEGYAARSNGNCGISGAGGNGEMGQRSTLMNMYIYMHRYKCIDF